MTPSGAAGEKRGRRGRLAVLAILGLGLAAAAVKLLHERTVGPHVESRIAALEAELAAGDSRALLAENHRGLRELLERRGAFGEFIAYRDRAIPLLEDRYRRCPARERSAPGAGWLLILLKIDSARSLKFFEEATPSIADPDLRREAESYLRRHAPAAARGGVEGQGRR